MESFLDKMGKEIDRRVDERLAEAAPKAQVARSGTAEAQRLALAIVSVALGTVATVLFVLLGEDRMAGLIPVWAGIIIVNAIFNGSRKG
ncbi:MULTISPECIES: hypothetical protein [unclassified Nonomuraea]|uniref:hypothetical protein n=1 Tax=unclassified Nonomuraea TaxID=2593643 RepID=UPI0035C0E1ED